MLSIHDPLPKYLLGKYQLISTVTFTAFFSLLLIVCFTPFSHNAWFKVGPDQAFVYTIAFFGISLAVVIASRRLMYSLRSTRSLTVLHYLVWCTLEVLVIAVVYTCFTLRGEAVGIINLGGMKASGLLLRAIVFGTVCLGIPYLLCAQYFAIVDKNNTIRLLNMGSVVTDVRYQPHEEQRITLFDNNGTLKFSISQENLIFIESDDNYIQVWYRDGAGEMRQYMLRCKLKTIEDSFTESCLVRCHRKYVVNIAGVKLLTCEKDGYYVDFGIEGLNPIPVSKTYEKAVLARFNSR